MIKLAVRFAIHHVKLVNKNLIAYNVTLIIYTHRHLAHVNNSVRLVTISNNQIVYPVQQIVWFV